MTALARSNSHCLVVFTSSAENILSFSFIPNTSFDGQNVDETGDFKDIINGFVDIFNNHFTLLVHGLLSLQQNAQTCGGQVLQGGKVQDELCNTGIALLQFCFQLGSGGCVQSAGDVNSQFGSVEILFDSNFIILLFLKLGGALNECK